MNTVVIDVVNGGRMQDIIGRLAARAVTKEKVLESLKKRLSEQKLDNDEIMAVMVELLQ